MAKLIWDQVGERYYGTGVDHVILFPFNATTKAYQTGVAWSGITAINENTDGGDANDLYADNIKYATMRSAENFKFTIEAYQSPEEFDACDGSANLVQGLAGIVISQQARQMFGMAYRTNVGSDATTEAGYVYHLVYGATAAPSDKSHSTVNDSPDAETMSWECETTPVNVTGFKPTAHLTIDTTKLPQSDSAKAALAVFLKKIEGDDQTTSGLPMPDEVATIFKNVTA